MPIFETDELAPPKGINANAGIMNGWPVNHNPIIIKKRLNSGLIIFNLFNL